mgnify:CR=1 FL=1|tara:strand:- start:1786 stop:2022 length:237 start_codon:yes stop_codon:yes gene_type:complete
MSREELSNFINAAERKPLIREELSKAKDIEEIILLANKYGFKITEFDFKKELLSEIIENWFEESQIPPLKNFNQVYDK